jgi:hypothetical protein
MLLCKAHQNLNHHLVFATPLTHSASVSQAIQIVLNGRQMKREETKPVAVDPCFRVVPYCRDHLQVIGQGLSSTFRTGESSNGESTHEASFGDF